jgi:riboflavin synthase alpha subunit
MKGKHSINLYVDFDNEIAGHFVTGHYQAHKAMLIAAAQENPSFHLNSKSFKVPLMIA